MKKPQLAFLLLMSLCASPVTAAQQETATITGSVKDQSGAIVPAPGEPLRLVDQCGLKGMRQGDAQISHIHANIMVNLGRATATDVRRLITIAQQAVETQHGVHLEPEIGFIGEF